MASRVRDLGIIVDSELTFQPQVSAVCAVCCYSSLETISRVRQSLSREQVLLLVNALVISRLLFCNSIYNGLSSRMLKRLQGVLSASEKLVSVAVGGEKFQAQWNLPIRQLVKLRTAAFTRSILISGKPLYLNELHAPSDHLTLSI